MNRRSSYLKNTVYSLDKAKPLTIAYLGGSITAGTGATEPETKCWRACTTAWFRKHYPQSTIREINAAIGGTGSDLGAFRCRSDVLAHSPDLVFVEFAVNDNSRSDENILRSMEGVVRQIRYANPNTDIVFIYTIEKNMAQAYVRGETPRTVLLHQRVADYYGIPSVNVGMALWQCINDGNETWETMTTDSVHPTDAGYAVYMHSVCRFLEEELQRPYTDRPTPQLPNPMTKNPFERVCLLDAWHVKCDGWMKEEQRMSTEHSHLICCNTPGTTLDFEFHGTVIGIFFLISPDSGDVEWSIDGSNAQRYSCWDHYALRFERAAYCVFNDGLEDGSHHLTIRILAEKNERSTGTWIRIGAFITEEFQF